MGFPNRGGELMQDIDIKSLIGQEVRAHVGIREYQGRERNYIKYYIDDGDGLPPLLSALLLSNWGAWLDTNPCPSIEKGAPTINLWIIKAAGAALFHKLPPEWAVELIRRAMTRTEKQPREVERTVERVYGGAVTGSSVPGIKVKEFEPDRVRKAASRVGPDHLRLVC